jgi:hypothetical protein
VLRSAAAPSSTRSAITRGYLAARLIAAVVEGGALCSEELGVALATRVGADPYLRSHGFLD